jgi:hypothetical protein
MQALLLLWVKGRQIVVGRIRPLSAGPPITKLDGHPRQHSTDRLWVHAIFPIDKFRDGDEVRAALEVRHPYLSWAGSVIPSSPWRRQLGQTCNFYEVRMQPLRGPVSTSRRCRLGPVFVPIGTGFVLIWRRRDSQGPAEGRKMSESAKFVMDLAFENAKSSRLKFITTNSIDGNLNENKGRGTE